MAEKPTKIEELSTTNIVGESSSILTPDSAGANDAAVHLVAPTDTDSSQAVSLRRDHLIGTVQNGQYRVIERVGRGATSIVYKAVNLQTGMNVAMKVLHEHLLSDAGVVRRFEQESNTSNLLQHPNIVCVRDCGRSADGQPYIVMDFVDGMSLQAVIQKDGWLPVSQAMAIFVQICAALSIAHRMRIVHRDLKPGNIMLTTSQDGELLVKVLDFGIAKILPSTTESVLKLTQNGETLGSLLYMSPEQVLDQPLDARSDCYSMGCLMYEVLTGTPPLVARTAFETMNKQISELPAGLGEVRPDLQWPKGLQDILFRAMAKKPENRYQSMSDLQRDLQIMTSLAGETGGSQATDGAGEEQILLALRSKVIENKVGVVEKDRHETVREIERTRRPIQVSISLVLLRLFHLAFVFGLLTAFSILPSTPSDSLGVFAITGWLTVAVLTWLTLKVSSGRSWARLVYSILFGLYLVPWCMTGQVVAYLVAVSQAVAIWLLWTRPANAWFLREKIPRICANLSTPPIELAESHEPPAI